MAYNRFALAPDCMTVLPETRLPKAFVTYNVDNKMFRAYICVITSSKMFYY